MSSILTYGRSLRRANEPLAGLAGRSLSQEPAVIRESLDAGASMTTSDQHQGAEVHRTQRSGKSVVPDRAASTQEMAVQGKPIDIGIRRQRENAERRCVTQSHIRAACGDRTSE
jgi:hypothetical protein